MKKISKVATGTPLKQSSPAAIERFITDKVRNELGEFNDLASIRTLLRIDKEDGDLSGNVTDGFGTVVVSVGKHAVHLPFIIHQKELLPFDVLRMGEEEVSYDLSKLRKVVVALDKKHKEGDDNDDSQMSVVDAKDVPFSNGFLGTIMSVRDSHKNRDMNGVSPYQGESFGTIDDTRLNKSASVEVDISETFETFHEKLANVFSFSKDEVKQVLTGIQKKAADKSQEAIDSIPNVKIETKEQNRVQREIATLDKDNLVDVKRAVSGNNIVFPVFDDQQFEYRQGRIYHKIESMLDSPLNTDIKHIVLDNKGGYAFLKNTDKFMASTREPDFFDMSEELSRGLAINRMYTFEKNDSTLAAPFVVESDFVSSHEDNFHVSVPERRSDFFSLKADNSTLFRNAFICKQTLHTASKKDHYKTFSLFLLKGSSEGLKKLNQAEMRSFISENETGPEGIRTAEHMMMMMYMGMDDYFYLVGEDFPFFKLEKRIEGHFTRPDGFFKEGPMFKQAAYDNLNKARLYIHENPKPVTYSLEWSFPKTSNDEEGEAQGLETRKLEKLSPAQARKLLQDLGYDARKQEMFFEIAKRNGRYAEFALPNVQLAEQVAPQDQGIQKAKEAFGNIANSTLNASNFTPILGDMVADNLSDGIGSTLKNLFTKRAEQSYEVAQAFEKIAETIRGKTWVEAAQILNAKHHLDKLAEDITEGFVKSAEPVFGEIKTWESAIAKTASNLVSFNREQLLHSTKPLVEPSLIKEALSQLDELTGYVYASPLIEKHASFFTEARVTK